MKVINRQTITSTLTQNQFKNDMSMLPMLTAGQLVYVDWYVIDKELSHTQPGFDYIAGKPIDKDSKIVFNKISNLPVAGIDDLQFQTEFDDDEGHVPEGYNSDGFVFAHTVNICEDNFFVITTHYNGETQRNIFRVTAHRRNFIKNMSIIEFDFKFHKNDKETYEQLEKQVNKRFTCMSNSYGGEANLILEDESVLGLRDKVENYSDLVEAYKAIFYNQETGYILYPIEAIFPAVMLWDRVFMKVLVDNRIIYFDPVLDMAKNEFSMGVKRQVIDIDTAIKPHNINTCILTKIVERKPLDKSVIRPIVKSLSPYIAKYQATRLAYSMEWTNDEAVQFSMINLNGDFDILDNNLFDVFDEPFYENLKSGKLFKEDEGVFAWDIKNLVIQYYNGQTIDFDKVEFEMDNSIDHFYLVPIIIYAYQQSILGTVKN